MTEEGWLARLRGALGNRHIVPPDPPGRKSTAPPVPEDIGTGDGCRPDASASWSCFITYTDRGGEESQRTITIQRIYGHYGVPESLQTRCHLRNAPRRFEVSRITGMACAVTGLELDPLENCLALHRDGALKIEDVALTRMIRFLTFMARCDGEFHPLERTELDDVLGRYFRFFGGDDAAYECAIAEAPRLAPSGQQFLADLRWLKDPKRPRRSELARFAIDSAAAMIDADRVHHSEEVRWAIDVSDALTRIVRRDL